MMTSASSPNNALNDDGDDGKATKTKNQSKWNGRLTNKSVIAGTLKPRPKSAAVKGNLKLRLDNQLQAGSAIAGTSPRKPRPAYNTPIKKGTILASDLNMCPYEEYGCEGLIVSDKHPT